MPVGTAAITVLTCTIPGREKFLQRNLESVWAQTVRPYAHLIISDNGSLGTERKYNMLAKNVETEWIAFLDDDNYLLPHHIETISPFLADDVAVVYSWDAGKTRPRVDLSEVQRPGLISLFQDTNVVDQSCAVRSWLFNAVGGFPQPCDHRPTDQMLWLKIADAGGRFRAVPEETWFYETHW